LNEQSGDIANLMVPVAGVVQAIKSQIQGVMPQVSFELGMISETLSSIVIEVGEAMNSDYDISPSSSEAQKTLAEANSMAQQRMRESLPALPVAAQPVPTALSEHTPV
jgi:division protein CdvB (Snf7/Vps24/ESCRT-III family)